MDPGSDGFDLDRHALSQLSLGTWGFVQIANFLVTGLLVIAAARGLRNASGSVWGPRPLAWFGGGMLIAGVFGADPANGFPAGTPDGPGAISWHGILHSVGFLVAMVSWTAAMIVLTRSNRIICGVALVAAAVVAVAPQVGSFGWRALVLCAVQLTAVAVLCGKALRAGAPTA